MARVLVVARDEARLAALGLDLGDRIVPICADLSDTADVDALLVRLAAVAPDLSLVINNAGTQLLMDFTSEGAAALLPAIRTEVATNFTSVVALSAGLLPLLAQQPSAAIVNVTSGLALAPKKSAPVYCAAKAGLRAFTRSLRYQCEDQLSHVRIIEALPPLVDTAMTQGRGRGKMTPESCAAEIIAGVRAGRSEIYVGKSKLLRSIKRLSPALGYRIMREG